MITLILTEGEKKVIVDALTQIDDEYGLAIEPPNPLRHTHTIYDTRDNTPSVADCPVCRYPETVKAHRAAVEAAYKRGSVLIDKVKNAKGYAAAPEPLFEIIRGMPPYPAPEGQEWTYIGDRVWELSDPVLGPDDYRLDKFDLGGG